MHRRTPVRWAIIATITLLVSTAGFSTLAFLQGGEDDAPAAMGGHAAHTGSSYDPLAPIGLDADSEFTLVHEPPFPLEEGQIPTESDALDFDARFSRFIAKGDAGIDELAAAGHLAGSGTAQNPYVLDSFYVDGPLTIESTDRALVLRNGYVDGQLSLNYVGSDVYVHHVYADDLRVNENVERYGANTGGLFHDNHFGFVGQIRHFVGAFRDNQVGPIPDGVVATYLSDTGVADVPEGVVFNFDGFHGADVYDNTFIGMVDIKLHGHNHGDCLTCPIHDHTDTNEFPGSGDHGFGHEVMDALDMRSRHSIRYHSLMFRDNVIRVDEGPALRYNDRNHAGDDQTANSEPNPYLEDPHVHFQDITLRGNTLDGGHLILDVFNAEDANHVVQNAGALRIEGNQIVIPYHLSTDDQPLHVGMDLRRADGIELRIRDNDIRFDRQDDGMPAATLRSVVQVPPPLTGILMDTFEAGNLTIAGNTVNTGDYGIWARTFAGDVHWALADNAFGTDKAYRADGTANMPETTDDEEAST